MKDNGAQGSFFVYPVEGFSKHSYTHTHTQTLMNMKQINLYECKIMSFECIVLVVTIVVNPLLSR